MAVDRKIPGKGTAEEDQKRLESAHNQKSIEEPIGNYGNAKGSVSMTLMDPDLLHCPVCSEPLSSPVYQCEKGHIACASCCTKTLKNKCWNCRLPIGNIRNRAVEHIIKTGRVTCQYARYGCNKTLCYSKKDGHEKECNYVPCSCPCCDYLGTSSGLYYHFCFDHKGSSKQIYFNSKTSISMDTTQDHVILREGTEGVLFILNRRIETFGSYFNVVCVASLTFKKRFLYELTASKGEDSITLKSSVEMVSKWTTLNMSLGIPSNFISTTQPLRLVLIIKKKPSSFVNFLVSRVLS